MKGHQEHTKALPIFLVQVFVVHFVRTPDSPKVEIITVPEELKPLVNEYVVYREISEAIGSDAYADI